MGMSPKWGHIPFTSSQVQPHKLPSQAHFPLSTSFIMQETFPLAVRQKQIRCAIWYSKCLHVVAQTTLKWRNNVATMRFLNLKFLQLYSFLLKNTMGQKFVSFKSIGLWSLRCSFKSGLATLAIHRETLWNTEVIWSIRQVYLQSPLLPDTVKNDTNDMESWSSLYQ